MTTIALDRASVRRIDEDGRLHVAVTNISKANVCPYAGREIPDYERLGLDADRIYQLYRDPAELEKGAASFNNIPLLSEHVPVSVDDHRPDLVVGSTGSDAVFDGTYLRNSLVVWARDAIDGIESNRQRELSCAYRYDADMTPGEANGVRYDGVMRNLRGNHVALVETGRAGADVVVGDSIPSLTETIMRLNSRRALVASGALTAYLAPKLAMDAKVDLGPVLEGVTAKTWKAKRADIVAGLAAATKGKLAQDASLDDVVGLLDRLEDGIAEGMDELPDEDDEEKKAAEDEDDEDGEKKPAEDEEGPAMKPVTKAAMDAAISDARASARAETVAHMNAIREAERAVRPYVGEIAVAMDSAEAVYRFALDKAGVDHKGLHPTALKPVLLAQPVPGSVKPKTTMAHDAAAAKSFAERFPGADRIRHA